MLAENSLSGHSFLVVDDDAACVHMTSLILKAHGATVLAATSGAEAIHIIQTTPPDMILADLLMPMMDGWALVKTLKSDPLTSAIPVVAITASYLNPDDITHAIAVGFAQVLPKPISISSLMTAISLAEASISSSKTA